ncbi:Class II abasic (AP) endonuclease [Microbotryomycetes sp. JL201]|nr:Class II abasic (AP) endonuclease [Microbotryomycetes sp. JL201]
MEKSMAVMNKWECFYSFFSRSIRGIHGTATFTKSSSVVPLKAEEGLGTSLIPVGVGEQGRIGGYPLTTQTDLSYVDMKDLDAEGRSVVLDCGLFVLFNLYCPNETNEERLIFKNHYNDMLDKRVRNLIAAGRQVIVTGDINICASDLDTVEPEKRAKEGALSSFMEHPSRKWFRNFIGPNGVLVDVTRMFHPNRIGMFTCWNQKIDARPANYGARIDYFLVTPGLLPWVKDSDIMPDIVGSDHCPVYLDLHDEIEIEGRGKVRLWDELNPGRTPNGPSPEVPAMAARKMKEFGGGQQTIARFFKQAPPVKKVASSPNGSNPAGTLASEGGSGSLSRPAAVKKRKSSQNATPEASNGSRRASSSEPSASKGTLASFVQPPAKPSSKNRKTSTSNGSSKKSSSETNNVIVLAGSSDEETDAVAKSASRGKETLANQGLEPEDYDIMQAVNAEAANQWQGIFAQKAAPLCTGHREPSKMMTVNKTGINKGRRFFLCARPVGPGYDKGQGQDKVNKEYRCDFFQCKFYARNTRLRLKLTFN